jgi:hypothetical protein
MLYTEPIFKTLQVRKYKPVCYANDGGGRAGRAGLNVPGNLPLQPPSGFFSHTAI